MNSNAHELLKYQILKLCNDDKCTLNDAFKATMLNILQKGLQVPFVEKKQIDPYENIENCQRQWKSLYNAISKSKGHHLAFQENKFIKEALQRSKLCIPQSDITNQGFKFILSTTSNQLNEFIYNYTLVVKEEAENQRKSNPQDVTNFILTLCTLSPYRIYQMTWVENNREFSQLEQTIINDFASVGLLWKDLPKAQTFSVSLLLSNFAFSEPIVNVNIKCHIIVETNFSVYAEIIDPKEYDDVQELLQRFCKIKYLFPHLIVGKLCYESVKQANDRYKINSDLIIDFFRKCSNPIKLQLMKEKKKDLPIQSDTMQQRKLDFLKLFNLKEDLNPIPNNVIQLLQIWELEGFNEQTAELYNKIKKTKQQNKEQDKY